MQAWVMRGGLRVTEAGMVDKRPRKSVGRSTFTDQVGYKRLTHIGRTEAHVAYMLWNRPREARKLYWAVWRRNLYKAGLHLPYVSFVLKPWQDAEARKFWSKHFPVWAPEGGKSTHRQNLPTCQDSSYCLYEDSTSCSSLLRRAWPPCRNERISSPSAPRNMSWPCASRRPTA